MPTGWLSMMLEGAMACPLIARKRREFIRRLIHERCHLKRHGAGHDLYCNPKNGKAAPVPRHQALKESLARLILKRLGLD